MKLLLLIIPFIIGCATQTVNLKCYSDSGDLVFENEVINSSIKSCSSGKVRVWAQEPDKTQTIFYAFSCSKGQ